MYDIVTIGSATRDAFFQGLEFDYLDKNKRIPGPEELCLPLGGKMRAQNVIFATGGAGTNAAVTFSRLGLKTAAVVCVGDDLSGKEIATGLQAEGVDTSLVQTHPSLPTNYSVILMAEGAERTILVFKGAGSHIASDKIPWQDLSPSWFYLNSLSENEEILARICALKKEKGIKLAWNPGSGDLGMGLLRLKPYLASIDVFITNNSEAAELLSLPEEKEEEIFRQLDSLIGGIAIMTMGPKGVLVSDGKTIYHALTFPEKAKVDRTGAGDAFGSGFVYGYMQGGIEEGIRVGSANGTSVLEHVGAKEGILQREQLTLDRWQNLAIERRSLGSTESAS